MVLIDSVSEQFQLQLTVSTCQNFFDRSSLRSTGARDQKKSFLSSCPFISGSSTFYSVFNSTAYTGADGDPGVLFPQNCFFDITFVFGFVEWDAPRFSTALTKLDDRGLFHKALLLVFAFFFSLLRVSGCGQNKES